MTVDSKQVQTSMLWQLLHLNGCQLKARSFPALLETLKLEEKSEEQEQDLEGYVLLFFADSEIRFKR